MVHKLKRTNSVQVEPEHCEEFNQVNIVVGMPMISKGLIGTHAEHIGKVEYEHNKGYNWNRRDACYIFLCGGTYFTARDATGVILCTYATQKRYS